MLLIITLALVHFSSDLGRGSRCNWFHIFLKDSLFVRFWDNLLEFFVIS